MRTHDKSELFESENCQFSTVEVTVEHLTMDIFYGKTVGYI